MQSIGLTKSNDRTDDVHVLSQRFTKVLELPERIALSNITHIITGKISQVNLGILNF